MSQAEIFKDTAEKIFAACDPNVTGFDSAMWSAVEESGFDRVLMPEDDGGAGDAFAEAVAVAMPLGRQAVGVPLVETMVANWSLSRAKLKVEEGPKAFVVVETTSGALTPTRDVVIPWAPTAQQIVVLHRDAAGRARLGILQKGAGSDGTSLAGEPLSLLAGGSELKLASAVPFAEGDLAFALAALLKSAAMAGGMATALDLSVEYANSRKQFGRRIGAFQAVQHMVVSIASEKSAVDAAVEFGTNQISEQPLWAAALAKSRASEAAGQICANAHQLHGAIGFTREYALHRVTRRLWSWRDEFGSEAYWQQKIGEAVLQPGRDVWTGIVEGVL